MEVRTLARSRCVRSRYRERVRMLSLARWAAKAWASARCSGVLGCRSWARSVGLSVVSRKGVGSRENWGDCWVGVLRPSSFSLSDSQSCSSPVVDENDTTLVMSSSISL